MYDGPEIPRYNISYLDPDKGWQTSKWKMTIRYAAIQFAGLEWDPIWPSEMFYRPEDIPIIHPGQSTAKFQGLKE